MLYCDVYYIVLCVSRHVYIQIYYLLPESLVYMTLVFVCIYHDLYACIFFCMLKRLCERVSMLLH